MTQRMSKADRIAMLAHVHQSLQMIESALGSLLSRRRFVVGLQTGDRVLYKCVFCGSTYDSSGYTSSPIVNHLGDCPIMLMELAALSGGSFSWSVQRELAQLELDYDYDQAKQDDHALLFGLD